MRRYHRREWLEFRNEIIELDGGVCTRCHRGPSDGAILQVHHKEYIPGKLPWEYPYELCETLCKGCHASEHDIIIPFRGWECVGCDDLGELSGECELCGTAIRHVFFIQHAKWPSLEVGETCCDHLTNSSEASDHMDEFRRSLSRQRTFITSKRWTCDESGRFQIRQKGALVCVDPTGAEFKLSVNNISGRRRFPTVVDAKRHMFELLENGSLVAFLQSRQTGTRASAKVA